MQRDLHRGWRRTPLCSHTGDGVRTLQPCCVGNRVTGCRGSGVIDAATRPVRGPERWSLWAPSAHGVKGAVEQRRPAAAVRNARPQHVPVRKRVGRQGALPQQALCRMVTPPPSRLPAPPRRFPVQWQPLLHPGNAVRHAPRPVGGRRASTPLPQQTHPQPPPPPSTPPLTTAGRPCYGRARPGCSRATAWWTARASHPPVADTNQWPYRRARASLAAMPTIKLLLMSVGAAAAVPR